MFFNPKTIPGVCALSRNWLAIRNEFDASSDDRFLPWRERHIYEGNWDTLFLFDGYKGSVAKPLSQNCDVFPLTTNLVASIPGLLSAGFSRLGPHAQIMSHRGFDPHVVRVHLGIHVPVGCWLAVRWERLFWADGDLLAFDDTQLHMAENPTDYERIVLIVDIDLKQRPSDLLPRLKVTPNSRDLLRYPMMAADLVHRRVGKALRKRVSRLRQRRQNGRGQL